MPLPTILQAMQSTYTWHPQMDVTLLIQPVLSVLSMVATSAAVTLMSMHLRCSTVMSYTNPGSSNDILDVVKLDLDRSNFVVSGRTHTVIHVMQMLFGL
jgi:hypothetical protein